MNRGSLYAAVILLLAAVGWLKFCHDPAIRNEADISHRGDVTDSAAGAVRESVRHDSARTSAVMEGLRRDTVTVVRTLRRVDTLLATIHDTIIRRTVDSIVVGFDSIVAVKDRRITSLLGLIRTKDSLLDDFSRVTHDLTKERDDWHKVAVRKWHLVAGVGGVLGADGQVRPGLFAGLAITP